VLIKGMGILADKIFAVCRKVKVIIQPANKKTAPYLDMHLNL
jgi:hypothetical protein